MKALTLMALVLAGCARTSNSTQAEPFLLCVTRFGAHEHVEEFLARHGIESQWVGGTLGAVNIYVLKRETAFRARGLLQENAEIDKFGIGWMADYRTYPGDAGWLAVHDPPSWLRVADVRSAETPTQTVLAQLEAAGIEARFDFGSTDDCVQVSREAVRRALGVLRNAPQQGVKIRPPVGFEQ